MSNGTKVVKRNGNTEHLNLDKIHKMVESACEGLAGVSASQVEMQSGIQFYDGITTPEIQEILIRSASDLIDLDHPNYQFVAARLLLMVCICVLLRWSIHILVVLMICWKSWRKSRQVLIGNRI